MLTDSSTAVSCRPLTYGAHYLCPGPRSTHGIGYSYVNNHLYVECSNPENCEEEDYQDGAAFSPFVMVVAHSVGRSVHSLSDTWRK